MNEPEYVANGHDSEDIAAIGNRPARGASVLVVSSAPVTAIVVSRIVAMTGLKCTTLSPFEVENGPAMAGLAAVIVDEDAELAGRLAARLKAGSAQRPLVLLLATGGPLLDAARRAAHVDRVIAKPVTSESLQPLLFDLRPAGDDLGPIRHPFP